MKKNNYLPFFPSSNFKNNNYKFNQQKLSFEQIVDGIAFIIFIFASIIILSLCL